MTVRYVDSDGNRRDVDGNPITKNTPGARPKRSRSKTWRVGYKDAAGKSQSATLKTTDRNEAQERLAEFLKRQKQRESDPYAVHCETPLSEHLDDFRRFLEAKNSSAKHVDKTTSYVARAFDWCGFKLIKDLDANAVADYLHERRKPVPVVLLSLKQASIVIADAAGLSESALTQFKRLTRTKLPAPDEAAQQGFPARWNWSTLRPILQREFNCSLPRQCPLPDEPGMSIAASNDYVASVRNFANWMVRSRRMPENPFRYVAKLKADSDPRHQRRPVNPEDFADLLLATANGKTFRGLTGPDRVMIYLIATTTGFRASELASLTENSFELESESPCLRVQAAYSKRRRNDAIPLKQDIAELLRGYIPELRHRRNKATLAIGGSDEVLWSGSWTNKAAEMLRRDLEAAGIPYEDGQGRFLDFHALRHTFGTNLAKAGVTPKVAQELMRHSDVKLTLNTYTHVGLYDLAGAVEKLPAFSGHSTDSTTARTGTDSVTGPWVALKTGKLGGSQELSHVTGEQEVDSTPDSRVCRNSKVEQEVTHFSSAHKKEPPMRLELMTYALRKRRSAN